MSGSSRFRAKHRAGYTLLEVMLALVILAVGLTAITQSVMMVMRSSALSARYTQASILAQNKMEEVLAREDPPKPEEHGEYEDHPGFTWKVLSERSAIENLPQIRVQVGFPAPSGPRVVEYVTLRANRTPPATSTPGTAGSGSSATGTGSATNAGTGDVKAVNTGTEKTDSKSSATQSK